MFDTLLWVTLIICFFIIINTWFPDLDKIFKKEFKALKENTWKIIDSLRKAPDYGNKEEAIKSYQKRLRDFEKAHISYLHLKERCRHDSKINQIKKDWKSYLDSIGEINKVDSEYYAYGMYSDNDVVDALHEREDKAGIVIEEIEKRFKDYLKN